MQLNFSVPSIGAIIIASLAGLASPASAIQINFDDQGLIGPDNFNQAGDAQTLDIATEAGDVQFDGGVIISEATNLFNETSIYGTANNISAISNVSIFDNPTRQNPLVIEFENPIENFFLDVFNGIPISGLEYTVADDIGNSSTFAIDSNLAGGFQTIGFSATGTVVTITADTSETNGAYDFFIDNINFDADLPDDIIEAVEEIVVPTEVVAPTPSPAPEQPTAPEKPPTPLQPITPIPEQPAPASVPEPVSVVGLLAAGLFVASKKSSHRKGDVISA